MDLHGKALEECDWGLEPTVGHVIGEDGGKRLAFPAGSVRQVIRYTRPLPVETSNPLVLGVIHYRNEYLPVISLKPGLDGVAVHPDHAIVMVTACGMSFGIRVDRVLDYAEIATASLEEGQDGNEAGYPFVKTVTQLHSQPVLIVDLEQVVKFSEEVQPESVAKEQLAAS